MATKLVRKRKKITAKAPRFNELGSTGRTSWGVVYSEEFNSELRGRNGIRIYDRMRRGDGQIRGIMRAVKIPLLAAEWGIKAGGEDPASLRNAEMIDWALFERLENSFIDVVSESLLHLDYGNYAFEKVFDLDVWPQPERTRGRGAPRSKTPVVVWKKFAPRHPRTFRQWNYDESTGEVLSVDQEKTYTTGSGAVVTIPVEKLLHFVNDPEAGNPEGFSLLRSAYKHWYIKDNLYKIDAIQKERHSLGVPEIGLPANFTESDKTFAKEMAENMRANEKAYIIRLPGWEIGFAEIHSMVVNIMASIEHHDVQIARNMLAQFLNLGTGGESRGSTSLADSSMSLFLKSLKHIGQSVTEVFNGAIKELIDYNFSDGAYPKLVLSSVGENIEMRTISVAMRNLVETNTIQPDEALETWVREKFDMPEKDTETVRLPEDDPVGVKEATGKNVAKRAEKSAE